MANFGLFLASICFVYAVKTTHSCQCSIPRFAHAPGGGRVLSLPRRAHVTVHHRRTRRSASSGLIITVVSDLEAGSMVGNVQRTRRIGGLRHLHRLSANRHQPRLVAGAARLRPDDDHRLRIRHIGPGQVPDPPAADIGWALFHGAVIIVVGTVMFNAASKHVPAVPMTVFAQTEMVFVPDLGPDRPRPAPEAAHRRGRRDHLRGGGGQGVVRRRARPAERLHHRARRAALVTPLRRDNLCP